MNKTKILTTFLILMLMNACNESEFATFDFNSDMHYYDYYSLSNKTLIDFIDEIEQDSISYTYFGDDRVYGVSIRFDNKFVNVYLENSRDLDLYEPVDFEKVKNRKIFGIDVYNGLRPSDLIISYLFFEELIK